MIQHLIKKLCLGLLLLHIGAGSSLAQKNTNSILLHNATIIDGRSNVRPYQASILIQDGFIRAISKKKINVGRNVQEIDCTGKYIVPGLFDTHIHLATIDLSDIEKARNATDKILENMLQHGITTVRDMAGNAPYLAQYKQEIKSGAKAGPDIFYAAQFAGPGYFEMFSQGSRIKMGNSPWERAVSDTTDIAQVVKQAKDAGVTAIKTYAEMSSELLEKIVRAARKQNLLVWSHATIYPIKPSDAVSLSVNSISHAADVIFEQIPSDSLNISYAWERVYEGIKVDPNILNPLFTQMKENKVFFDPTVFHATNNKLDYSLEILKLAHGAGVKIVAGTDWIYPENSDMVPLYNEVSLYQDRAGMTPLEVLESLTYNAAQVTGLHDRGYLKKGLRADILILDSDPLKNLRSLFEPEKVIQAGHIVK
ncbi:amidohydrolase family protein [Sphingobacterium tabacisoli]|uniref:Amidohydrolase family protein n=1 Tax=Sphingobacterium tabacisoli TaxID=2044855 RepID=A0ABW5L546_9SPHI|nr:amidohydrolase family protein [Sphingobacterium tabacisoli]